MRVDKSNPVMETEVWNEQKITKKRHFQIKGPLLYSEYHIDIANIPALLLTFDAGW